MLTLTIVLAAVLTQTDTPQKMDITELKKNMRVLTDGKGHFLTFGAESPYEGDAAFYGDGKTFHSVPVRGGGRNGVESFNVSYWDPRMASTGSGMAQLNWREGKYVVDCAAKKTELTLVPDEEAKAMLDSASFSSRLFLRQPERLLRDETGRYFFVDRYRADGRGKTFTERRDFRVFIGKRGRMKLQALKDIVDDTEGMIFSTKGGDLRLVAGKDGTKDTLKWVERKKEHSLVEVPLDDLRNVQLVYVGLGPYDGQRLGTPCDDLM